MSYFLRFTRKSISSIIILMMVTSGMGQSTVSALLVTNQIQDPGFEAPRGSSPWVENGGLPLCNVQDASCSDPDTVPNSGSGWAWLGRSPGTTFDLYQPVTIPQWQCGAKLQFYLNIGRADPGSGGDDYFRVYIDSVAKFTVTATEINSYQPYKLVSIDISQFADGGGHIVHFFSSSDQTVYFNVDDVSLVELNPGCTRVNVSTASTFRGTYMLIDGASTRQSYSNVDSGPMKVVSTYGVPIIASLRVAYNNGSAWTDFSEMMGLPIASLSTKYSFPVYDHIFFNSQLRFANVGASSTTVTVKVGTILHETYLLPPNQSRRISYAGVSGGPVVVQSSGGVKIIASLRVAYNNGSAWTSFSEMMGLPESQLSTSYLFPWYNNKDLDSQVRFGNVGNSPTNVTVTIGGVVKGTYNNLAPNASLRFPLNTNDAPYADLDNGPVKVTSSGGVPIVASIRVAYSPNGGTTWTSFSELMGLPSNRLTNSYVFPWYNNLDLNSQLRFGNVGTSNTTVTVTVGGVFKGNYNLAPNASTRISYVGLDNGPVKVTSSGNVPIIASLRVAYNNGSAWTSFSELMGLPASQLSTSYLFPWYNNKDLNSQVRFGNP